MHKIITFLGLRPVETDYAFGGHIYSGKVFAEALRQFVDYDQMLVCVTVEARSDAWPVLADLQDPRILAVPIPRAETTVQMWEMFDAILEHVDPGDTVIFDITHGLRSLPFLVFLFAAYLKTARQVKIEAIYYGALELGDRDAHKPAPVIDLSEFVTMLDWLTATDQFVQTGNARRLAELLDPGNTRKGASAVASETLSTVSQAALLCQPFALMQQVGKLEGSLLKAEKELKLTAHPFGVLRDQIVAAFTKFGADFLQDVPGGLKAEFRLIEWYYQNKQLIQAMSLAREWLIDAVSYRLGLTIDFKPEARSPVEWALSGINLVGRKFTDSQTGLKRLFTLEDLNEYGRTIYKSWPECPSLINIWNLLSPIRNALDHAEHQASALQLKKIIKKADEVMPMLRDLAASWSLCDPCS